MKLLNRLVIIVVISLGISGCQSKFEKAGSIILNMLEERYNEEFVIDSMGNSWGTADDSTIKAFVYPINHKEKMFRVTIKKDFSEVKDLYLPRLMEDKLQAFVEENYKTEFDKRIYTYIGSDYTSENYTDITLTDYFKKNSKSDVLIQIFLNVENESQIDKLKESQYIFELISHYLDKGYKMETLLIYYMKPDQFSNIILDDSKVSDNFAIYERDDYSYNSLGIMFKKYNYSLTMEDIYESFRK